MTRSDSPLIDWQCFSYLTADRGELYRAVIEVFADAKAEFSLHLRPAEIRFSLANRNLQIELADLESALQQLQAWGNLQSYQDSADVVSLAEYYRKRLLYQLSASGEAVHASTQTFIERLQQQAKLDARALERIATGSGQLERLANGLLDAPDDIDSAKVMTTLRSLSQDADDLTSRSQSFFRWLHEQTESGCNDLEAFLSYKEKLIDYLQQFVSELISRGGEIARRLNRINNSAYERLAAIAAAEDVGQPRVGEEDRHEARIADVTHRWLHKLSGLRGWFSRTGNKPSQLEQLRAAARAAIPRLLQLAAQMNDRQSGRSDRVADMQTLASTFLQCQDDSEAHLLFRAAFTLSPGRHLRVDQETLEARDQNPVGSGTRWLDAEPVCFSPQLRHTGRQPVAAANRRIIDRSTERAALKRKLKIEAGRDEAARETLIALGACRLSEIGPLESDAFRLLLELIERAAPRPNRAGSGPATVCAVSAKSRDGSLQISVNSNIKDRYEKPMLNGAAILDEVILDGIARLGTSRGELWMNDLQIEVTRAS